MRSQRARVEHWTYKLEGWDAFRDAQPNAAHLAIAKLEGAGKLLKLVTQNIDGLHQKAGNSRPNVVELHGTNAEVECQRCGRRSALAEVECQRCGRRSAPQPHFDRFRETGIPPLCACGGCLKQATISFGQNLRPEDTRAAERAALESDLVIAIGSSLSVYPAASLPLLAAERGSPYVVINRGPTAHDTSPLVTLRLEGDVVAILPPAVEDALSG